MWWNPQCCCQWSLLVHVVPNNTPKRCHCCHELHRLLLPDADILAWQIHPITSLCHQMWGTLQAHWDDPSVPWDALIHFAKCQLYCNYPSLFFCLTIMHCSLIGENQCKNNIQDTHQFIILLRSLDQFRFIVLVIKDTAKNIVACRYWLGIFS